MSQPTKVRHNGLGGASFDSEAQYLWRIEPEERSYVKGVSISIATAIVSVLVPLIALYVLGVIFLPLGLMAAFMACAIGGVVDPLVALALRLMNAKWSTVVEMDAQFQHVDGPDRILADALKEIPRGAYAASHAYALHASRVLIGASGLIYFMLMQPTLALSNPEYDLETIVLTDDFQGNTAESAEWGLLVVSNILDAATLNLAEIWGFELTSLAATTTLGRAVAYWLNLLIAIGLIQFVKTLGATYYGTIEFEATVEECYWRCKQYDLSWREGPLRYLNKRQFLELRGRIHEPAIPSRILVSEFVISAPETASE
jgi:hypothetical protein